MIVAARGAWQWLAGRARPDLAKGLILFALFAASLAAIQFSTEALAGTDGYYHVKMAEIMAAEGLVPHFRWLPLTILNQATFYDHHFLFHAALIPFVLVDPLAGAKWASVLFPTLAFMALWWTLRSQRVPYSALWSLGLLVISEAFLYRMSMVRAQALSLLVLAVGLLWMFNGKYRRLALLGFVYAWLYNAFPLLVVLALVYSLARWVVEGELTLQPVLYGVLGIGLGLLINPYFPRDVLFIVRHLLPKLTDPTSIRVGNEWFPYQTATLLRNSPLALASFAGGALALGLNRRRMRASTATAFGMTLVTAWMLFQSRRFIEYFPPFALLFAALAWSDLLEDMPPLLGAGRIGRPPVPLPRRWLTPAALLLVLVLGAMIVLPDARESLRNSTSVDRYADAAGWLADNTPDGSLVFQTDWDDFTRLFFHNTHNTYLVGLDPTYLQLYDSILYDLWVELTKGEVDQPAAAIRQVFGASYVFSDLGHREFLLRAEQDDGLVEVYRDQQAVIFRVAE